MHKYNLKLHQERLKRKAKVLALQSQGLSFRQIGKKLGISGARAHQLIK